MGKRFNSKPKVVVPRNKYVPYKGYRKARFRASFRARVGRLPGLTDKFFRLFSMFLVCLVLFTVVYDMEYEAYTKTVQSVYMISETVEDAADLAVNGLLAIGEWSTNLKESFSSKQGDQYEFHVKINGSYYRFKVLYVGKVLWSSQYEILEAYNGYESWVGMTFCIWLGWVTCPDYGMRVFKIYELPSEGVQT